MIQKPFHFKNYDILVKLQGTKVVTYSALLCVQI